MTRDAGNDVSRRIMPTAPPFRPQRFATFGGLKGQIDIGPTSGTSTEKCNQIDMTHSVSPGVPVDEHKSICARHR